MTQLATNPTEVDFQRVSPRLVTARVVVALAWLLVPTVVLVAIAAATKAWWVMAIAGVFLLLLLWFLWLNPRQVRAIGYATTEQEFLVRKGILQRSLVVVPYGRIQYVDVTEGPLARKLGIASIQLHTASAGTDASLDGLPTTAAAELRDLLVTSGSGELSGL